MVRRTYKTSRLVLRPYRASDFKVWAWSYAHALPKKHKYDWFPPSGIKWDLKKFRKIMLQQKKKEKREIYIWTIFEKRSGALVGHLDVSVIERDVLQFANLGYRINNRYWRKGYAREAVLAIIPAAFKDLKLNRLEAVIDPDNRPSIALAKAVGLVREGIRKKYYYQGGRWDDQVVFVGVREQMGFGALKL